MPTETVRHSIGGVWVLDGWVRLGVGVALGFGCGLGNGFGCGWISLDFCLLHVNSPIK